MEAAKSDDSIMSIVGRQSIQFWLVDYIHFARCVSVNGGA